jgi:DNA polymerase-3 subunit alpha
LFAILPPSNGSQHGLPPGHSPLPEWSESERLSREKAALGFYFSGHPFEKRGAFLSRLGTCDLSQLATHESGSEVMVAGMISSVRVVTIKSGRNAGQKMAKLRLEDLTGAGNATVFARTYAEVKDLLEEDAILFVKGRAETGGDEPGLLVDEILPVAQVIEQAVAGLVLRLEANEAQNETQLTRLQDLLSSHQGRKMLLLNVPGDQGRVLIRAGKQFGLQVSERLLDDLADFLRPAALSFVRSVG